MRAPVDTRPASAEPLVIAFRAMSSLSLKTAFVTHGHTQALKDGTVTPRTFAFDFEEVPVIIQAFRRMVRGLEFDISEMAITTYICARAHGKRFTAIPVFPMRAFHHGAIVYNTKAGITSPKDLEGRRVGVNRGYTVTTGLWARSILQHEYGVDLNKITWVLSGDEHVAEYQAPSNVVPIEKGKKMEDMLLSGDLAAAIGVQVESPDIEPLISGARDAGFKALRERGLYPINHTIVVKDDVLAAHPEVAADLFNAFAEAKRLYIERLRAGTIEQPSAGDQVFKRVMEITGDPLPYGIEPNRQALEAVIQHSVEQGILTQPFTVEELFAEGTRHLTA
jgi:4,5-dihydroxyphthalate decarboxylase